MKINKDRLQMYISLTKITIVLCWLSLFSFWAIKLFGGNWFEIIVKNENFVKFSDTVQNTWLKYLVSLITIFVSKYLTFGAICQKFIFKGKEGILIVSLIISIWALVNFTNVEFFKMWYAYIIMVVLGIVYHKGYKKTFGILAVILEFAFATLSMLVRNIDVIVLSNYFVAMIGAIDLYIMYGLYYLYSNIIRLNKEKV